MTRRDVQLVGQWRRVRVTVLLVALLLLIQWPMRQAVLDGDPTWATRLGGGGPVPDCVVPARLSLLIDVAFIYAYLLAAWRVRALAGVVAPARAGLVRSRDGRCGSGVGGRSPGRRSRTSFLWQRFGAPGGGSRCPALDVAVLSPAMWTLWIGGVALLLLALIGATRTARRDGPGGEGPPPDGSGTPVATTGPTAATGPAATTGPTVTTGLATTSGATGTDPTGHDAGGQIICCSGGGIRSAAFCLGALQVLTSNGQYQKSSSVIGVSGGGYIAAAFHVLRRSLGNRPLRPDEKLPYATGTPELARLRRQTHYLLPSISVGARGIMSLLYGAVVNLVLIGVALRAVSWLLGWAIAEAGVVEGLGSPSAALDFTSVPTWYWAAALGPLGVVVVLFVGEVVVDRFRVPPGWLRTQGRAFAQLLVIPAFVTIVLLVGLPLVLVWANNFGLSQTGGSPGTGPMDGLTDGLVDAASSVAGTVAGSGAAGADPILDSQFGLGTLVALGAAFIALARSAWKGLESAKGDGPGPDLRTRILTWARVKLVPWLGSALLLVAGTVVMLRWTAGYVASEEWRSRWWVAGLCAGLVLLIAVLTDATRTSLHPYYRERLATAYLARRTGDNTATDYDYAVAMPYSSWGCCRRRRPAAGHRGVGERVRPRLHPARPGMRAVHLRPDPDRCRRRRVVTDRRSGAHHCAMSPAPTFANET